MLENSLDVALAWELIPSTRSRKTTIVTVTTAPFERKEIPKPLFIAEPYTIKVTYPENEVCYFTLDHTHLDRSASGSFSHLIFDTSDFGGLPRLRVEDPTDGQEIGKFVLYIGCREAALRPERVSGYHRRNCRVAHDQARPKTPPPVAPEAPQPRPRLAPSAPSALDLFAAATAAAAGALEIYSPSTESSSAPVSPENIPAPAKPSDGKSEAAAARTTKKQPLFPGLSKPLLPATAPSAPAAAPYAPSRRLQPLSVVPK